MPLPKIEHPIHEVYLKSLDRKIKFRPFLVREEKLLLISKEAEDPNEAKNSIKQILQNCCLEELDIDKLPLFDIEMFFVHLRIKSIGESARLSFTCENIVEDVECGNVTDYTLDLNKISYQTPDSHNDKIQLGNGVGIKLKYPTMSIVSDDVDSAYNAALKVITENIEYIYDTDSVYKRSDISEKELIDFLEELTVDQIEEIRTFFRTSPKAVLEDTIKCSKCGFEHKVHAEDLYSFFI
jgi:hypothetical protein